MNKIINPNRICEGCNINSGGTIVKIIWESGVAELYGDLDTITLKDCRETAVQRGYKGGTITVIAENPLDGNIYRYGNHGDYWECIGEVFGYA